MQKEEQFVGQVKTTNPNLICANLLSMSATPVLAFITKPRRAEQARNDKTRLKSHSVVSLRSLPSRRCGLIFIRETLRESGIDLLIDSGRDGKYELFLKC